MARKRRSRARLAAAIVATLLLAGCAAGSSPWVPGTPRNGAGQLVDPVLGTPLPGQTMGYN